MATIQFKKGDEYLAKIALLETSIKEDLLGNAIYGAADIVTNGIRSELDKLPTDERFGTALDPTKGPRKGQVKALKASLGIAKMQNDAGYLNVKVGWDGYNQIKTKRWPNGEPNQMVARSIERGTSFMTAHPFVKKAVAATRKGAIQSMKQTIDAKCEEIMK